MTTVLLIRHGMTDYVAKRLCAGRTPGVSLNDEGRRQAETVAQRLAGLPIKAIYASPLERTMETAQAIAAVLNLAITPCPGILETNTGDWTGMPFADIAQKDAAVWNALHAHPSGTRIPGGETMDEIRERMATAVNDVCAAHPGAMVALVSHADPIKACLSHFLGLDLNHVHRIVIGPTSVSALQVDGQHISVLTMNHLGDMSQLAPKP